MLIIESLFIGQTSFALGQALSGFVSALDEGAGPIILQPDKLPASGAVNAVVQHPFLPNVVYVGAVSGGVWMTLNALSPSPNWFPLTDRYLRQLPINSLAISPINPFVIFAGTGNTTSFDGFGYLGIGVARSTDGGLSWKVLAGDEFTNRAINSIVPTKLNDGKVILAATWLDNGGVYRSIDNGEHFKRISGTSGLPNAGVTSLIVDPIDSHILYAAVPQTSKNSGRGAVYKSVDGGQKWTDAEINLPQMTDSQRILLAIHSSIVKNKSYNTVYAANVAWDNTLNGVFYSRDSGGSWKYIPNPSPTALFSDPSGNQHGAIAASPIDPNVVFLGGDEQTTPNTNGCNYNYATVYRFDLSAWENDKTTQWENLVCSGANRTAPHADTRWMTFNKDSDLLLATDGGLARLSNTNDAAKRVWISAVGNLRIAEFHTVGYDSLAHVIVAGSQDNASSFQLNPNGFSYRAVVEGDGGFVAVDANQKVHPGISYRYFSSEFSTEFNRIAFDSSNHVLKTEPVQLKITEGIGKGSILFNGFDAAVFYQPFALNTVDPNRMLIGTGYLYESLSKGDTLANLGPLGGFYTSCGGPPASSYCSGYGQPIAYGGHFGDQSNAEVFYVGAGNKIYYRLRASDKMKTLDTYQGDLVVTVVMHPKNYRHVFVSDYNNRVHHCTEYACTDITGNLPSLSSLVTTIEVGDVDSATGMPTLFAGGFGVFRSKGYVNGQFQWEPLVRNGNPALAVDLHYNPTARLLVAGTMGRGAWLYRDITSK
jgi:hypothetical protein